MSNVFMKRTSESNISENSSDHWSKLPEDLLRLVVDRMVSEKTFINFRSVCRDWRSAILRSYWKRTPWLLAKIYKTPIVVLKGLCSLPPSTDNMLSLYETKLHWRYWGSFTGWILGQHLSDYRLKLINPLTKAVIDLPRLHQHLRKGFVYHVPGSEPRNPTIGVMAISRNFNGIAMIDNEYKSWTFLSDIYESDFVDLIWYKDNVVALRANGAIVFYNKARKVLWLDSKPALVGECYEPYLVESSGDLLIVAKRVKVYMLNLDIGDWKVVRSLGRYSLFLGNSYSISRWISEDETTWKPSCIYNATYSSICSGMLSCYNMIKRRHEKSHDLGHVTDLNKCYDFIWYMPVVGSTCN